ncbi:uncharacterized protein EAE97_005471 [Botrytis byssoidea]|uniref:Uncharacterized protein n=1 Tax=Botrytis byssoidea TaxID=139641 RepID=A0A9P5M5V0_9HELO|nr:uncharacterized protein EAE97_005471 [Botrytis byssoidea]KAF7944838.1 hypothetical protein EAE97_005471 [Botrytis byssoidea]
MHSPTTDSFMDLQALLLGTPLPTSSNPTPPPTPQKAIHPTHETRAAIQSPDPKSANSDKHPRASHQAVYTSFSSLGLREPAGPKRVDTSSQEDLVTVSSPPTAMQHIKSVLGIELPQK